MMFTGWYDSNGNKWTNIGKYNENDDTTLKANWLDLSSLNVGDSFDFGTYPQTDVTKSLGSNLVSLVKEDGWKSYNYYVNEQSSIKQSNIMMWQDVTYNDIKYRGVNIQAQRPNSTTEESPNQSTIKYNNQYINGYIAGNIYWFKYEPISWMVKAKKTNTLTILSNVLLDAQQFYHTAKNDNSLKSIYDSDDQLYAYDNNYQCSDIRCWLNTSFYGWAFDSYDKTFIVKTLVDNSKSTTFGVNESYTANDTNDYVFLFSYQDYNNSDYFNGPDEARVKSLSDYAKSQGANESDSNGAYFSRSPCVTDNKEMHVFNISHGGGNNLFITERN